MRFDLLQTLMVPFPTGWAHCVALLCFALLCLAWHLVPECARNCTGAFHRFASSPTMVRTREVLGF